MGHSQANQQVHAGSVSMGNREYLVEAGSFLSSAAEVGSVVVGSQGQRPIFLRDVAMVIDGPEEPANYVLFGRGAGFEAAGSGHGSMQQGVENAVTIAISKRKSTNAAVIAEAVLRKVDGLKGTVIPADVAVAVTRDWGRPREINDC